MANVKIKLIVTLEITTDTADFNQEKLDIVDRATKCIKSCFSESGNSADKKFSYPIADNSVLNNININIKS